MSPFTKIFALVCALTLIGEVQAETLKPAFGGDFTFRKIKPPSKSTQKRITIQIGPDANPFPKGERKITINTPDKAPKATSKDTDWFWEAVSPDIGTPVAGRFSKAVAHLNKAPDGRGFKAPRLSALEEIANSHGTDILVHTIGKKISPALVLAVISVESGGRITAQSEKGAQGLMQLIPATAERFGVADSANASQNIEGGVKYLEWLVNEFKGDLILALAGYNAGEGAVRKHGGVPPYAETRAYVPKVLAAWKVAKGLCVTPPELATDGCVFRTRDS